MDISQASEQLATQITQQLLTNLKASVTEEVIKNVKDSMRKIDLTQVTRDFVSSYLKGNTQAWDFPERSIKGSAIDPQGLYITPGQITQGGFKNFESSGIQDKATMCQVTILDQATVFENKLVAGKLEIAEDAVIKGNLTIQGTIPADSQLFKDVTKTAVNAMHTELQSGVLEKFKTQAIDAIKTSGLNANLIMVNGKPLLENGKLAPGVLQSNLQSVGALKELQVIGETLLDETLYVSNGRVGINTLDPECAFDIWDQEVQISAFKYSQEVGAIGTTKNQQLILTSNRKKNLILNADGSVTVEHLQIGNTNMSSSETIPSADRPIGSIVWNSKPDLGKPIGWVSLGGARWAKFGIVEL
jgi:hypothetical protein